MQKLKKAIKKLAKLGASKGASRPAQAAKKATPVKKKSQPVAVTKKAAAKKPAAAPAKKGTEKSAAAAPKSAQKAKSMAKAAPAKPEVKDLKKKPAAAPVGKAAHPVKTAASKDSVKESDATRDKAKKPVQTQVKKAAEKPAPSTMEAHAPAEAKVKRETSAATVEENVGTSDAKARARKVKEEAPVETGESDEVVLTDAEGRRYCRVKDCDQIANVDNYCRYHYLLFWKNIQVRKKILTEGKLERYIEELTARYPDKYLEMLRKDLRNEKDFMSAIQELEIDEASVDNEYEDEAQSYLDEVRGMSSETSPREEEDF